MTATCAAARGRSRRGAGITLHEGVYFCLSGPNFETPAEIRMFARDWRGCRRMSTAHEVVVARHAGVRVMACSGITNVAIDEVSTDLEANHEEVLEPDSCWCRV